MESVKRLAAASALLHGCTPVRTLVHNFPDVDDHRIFASVRLGASLAIARALEMPENVAELRRLGADPSRVVLAADR